MPITNIRVKKQYFTPRSVDVNGAIFGAFTHRITEPEYEARKDSLDVSVNNVIKRDWDVNGDKGTVFEEWFNDIEGTLIGISFFDIVINDKKMGVSLNLTIRGLDGSEGVINTKVGGQFCAPLIEQLPNVDLDKDILFAPYAKKNPDGRINRNIYLSQDSENVKNFFKEWDDDKKQWKLSNKYPVVDDKKLEEMTKEDKEDGRSDYFKKYFKGVNKFLVKYAEDNLFEKINIADTEPVTEVVEDKEINAADVPF